MTDRRLSAEQLAGIRELAKQPKIGPPADFNADWLDSLLAHIDAQQAEIDRLREQYPALEGTLAACLEKVTAERDRLRTAFHEIEHNLPYRGSGQHVAFMGWSMPPSTEKALRRLVEEARQR